MGWMLEVGRDGTGRASPAPLVGRQRDHGTAPPLVRSWLGRATVVYSGGPESRPGYRSDACFRGAFDDNAVTHCNDPSGHTRLGQMSVGWLSIKEMLS